MLSWENVAEHQSRFGLSYHVPYAMKAETEVGLRGKSVLEVGGSLPKAFVLEALGARQWHAVEEMSYWHEIDASGGTQGTPPTAGAIRPLAAAGREDAAADYAVFSGRVEQLPGPLRERFDVAFSIAAFEHFDRLSSALEAIHAALRPGGRLFTMFSPIWSAFDGHHLPKIRDREGREFDFSSSPIPPWGHLLQRPPEMLEQLLAHTDRATAAEIVYYVYHSPHINRLFTEDYVAYAGASPFTVERIEATFPVDVPEEVQRALEAQYPRHRQFANNGMLLVLRK